MKESTIISHIRLDAAQRNLELWRNNSGGFYDETGRFVRYGLGSFLPQQKLKSSDFIGITPRIVTPDMLGQIVGIFTAVETKPENWKYNPKEERSLHQQNFINLVLKAGGYAGFARNIQEFRNIIKHG